MARTTRFTSRDEVTQTRQPRPRQRRTGTRHGIVRAALLEG